MNTALKAPTLNKFTEELENLLKKRIGGSVNFRGIYYQILYASYLILNELRGTSEKSITMEGIERQRRSICKPEICKYFGILWRYKKYEPQRKLLG